jgi:hypothetical protein
MENNKSTDWVEKWLRDHFEDWENGVLGEEYEYTPDQRDKRQASIDVEAKVCVA